MILFIFEGKNCEPRLFETLKQLFFTKEVETFVCTCNSNIYSLYSKLKGYDVFENVTASGNTVTILNDILQKNGDNTLADILEVDVSEIFLFFDYDFQESRLTLEVNNRHIVEMLEYFNDMPKMGNLIYAGVDAIPTSKAIVIQSNIYENQLPKYVNTENCRVAVLNSFPIFLYDYFRNIANMY